VTDWAEKLDGLHAGDLAATNQIIALITGYLAHMGGFELRDSWDDFVQEVLIALIRTPPNSREPGAIVRHIQTTCRRRYIDEIRRIRGRRRPREGEEDDGGSWRRNVSFDEAREPALADSYWSEQMDVGLRGALELLDERKRLALEAVYIAGCTYDEAALRLDTPLGTLKGLLKEGLSELRQKLIGETNETTSDSGGSSVSPSEGLARGPANRGGMGK
jgi:RNA polymerase sigma factor (sigma-70 family)